MRERLDGLLPVNLLVLIASLHLPGSHRLALQLA
jgi:hypothetical protein